MRRTRPLSIVAAALARDRCIARSGSFATVGYQERVTDPGYRLRLDLPVRLGDRGVKPSRARHPSNKREDDRVTRAELANHRLRGSRCS